VTLLDDEKVAISLLEMSHLASGTNKSGTTSSFKRCSIVHNEDEVIINHTKFIVVSAANYLRWIERSDISEEYNNSEHFIESFG
jgi:hypothetical protein